MQATALPAAASSPWRAAWGQPGAAAPTHSLYPRSACLWCWRGTKGTRARSCWPMCQGGEVPAGHGDLGTGHNIVFSHFPALQGLPTCCLCSLPAAWVSGPGLWAKVVQEWGKRQLSCVDGEDGVRPGLGLVGMVQGGFASHQGG